MLPLVFVAAAMSALPDLDIERVCRGGPVDNRTEEYRICVDSEHTARDALRKKWAQYPAKPRGECANVVRIAPESSYAELQTCIESQTGEAKTGAAPGK